MNDKEVFEGFESPEQNWSKLPHQLIDYLPSFTNLSGLKIVLYVLRHTWGYQDNYKKITIDEFINGRKQKDGTRIDNGTGLSKPSVVSGCKWAVKNGFLYERKDEGDIARIKKYYALTEQGLKTLTPGVKNFNTRGKESLQRTEKETPKETKESIAFSEILELWKQLFPNKPQPRPTNKKLEKKCTARLKNKEFQQQWKTALKKASGIQKLHSEGWFSLEFFLRNDENFQKILDGKYDWMLNGQPGGNGQTAQDNKANIKQSIETAINRYGGRRWTEAKNYLSPEALAVIDQFGAWYYVCGLTEKEFDYQFNVAYKQAIAV